MPLLENWPATSTRPSLVEEVDSLESPCVVASAHRLSNVAPPLTVRLPVTVVRPVLSNCPLTVELPVTLRIPVLANEAWLFRLNPPEAVKVPLLTMPPALGENWLETVIVAPAEVADGGSAVDVQAREGRRRPGCRARTRSPPRSTGSSATPPAAMSRVPAALFRYAGAQGRRTGHAQERALGEGVDAAGEAAPGEQQPLPRGHGDGLIASAGERARRGRAVGREDRLCRRTRDVDERAHGQSSERTEKGPTAPHPPDHIGM